MKTTVDFLALALCGFIGSALGVLLAHWRNSLRCTFCEKKHPDDSWVLACPSCRTAPGRFIDTPRGGPL